MGDSSQLRRLKSDTKTSPRPLKHGEYLYKKMEGNKMWHDTEITKTLRWICGKMSNLHLHVSLGSTFNAFHLSASPDSNILSLFKSLREFHRDRAANTGVLAT